MSNPRARLPVRAAFARSLTASGLVHGGLIGAGILLGIVFGFGGDGPARREYVTRIELGPAEPPFEDAEEEVTVTEVVDESPPELVEAELWQEPTPTPEEAPVPTRLVSTEWIDSLPVLVGDDLRPQREPALAPAQPVRTLETPREPPPAALRVPVVVAASARHAPAPAYPRLARRAGEEGSVLCRIHIRADGTVERVEVVESSGFERLDEAAREGLLVWRFDPRREDGTAVAEARLHRITFRLDAP